MHQTVHGVMYAGNADGLRFWWSTGENAAWVAHSTTIRVWRAGRLQNILFHLHFDVVCHIS